MKSRSLYIFILALLGFSTPPDKITVWLIGDSTMSAKNVRAYPETGWGMPFSLFFDSTVRVENRAMNGRSTKTFLSEGRWASVLKDMKKGDVVFIQFGHNDEVQTKRASTTEEEFRINLTTYISETRSGGGIPVLITPVARRKFDSLGRVIDTHEKYSAIVRRLAMQQAVQLIDLDSISRELLQLWGPHSSRLLFNYLDKGQHPNYPEGKSDDTHFNELGARIMAQLVLQELRKLEMDLSKRIIKPQIKQ